jgi:hypothetical protein
MSGIFQPDSVRHNLKLEMTRKEYVTGRHILDIYMVWEMG